MEQPDDDDFLNHKISDILRELSEGDEWLYAAQLGANVKEGIPPEIFVLVGRADAAQVVFDTFVRIAEEYGLDFKREI